MEGHPALFAGCTGIKRNQYYKGTRVLRRSFSSIQGRHGKPVKVVSAHVGPARASFPQDPFSQDCYRTVSESERASLTLEFPTLTKDSDNDA